MKIAVGLFISSAGFTLVLALAYWFLAHEPAGTVLLGFMTAALSVIAGYMIFAERDADLYADKPNATMREAARERVGTYITHSPIPFWFGLGVVGIAIGVVVNWAAAGLGVIALTLLTGLLIVRSR